MAFLLGVMIVLGSASDESPRTAGALTIERALARFQARREWLVISDARWVIGDARLVIGDARLVIGEAPVGELSHALTVSGAHKCSVKSSE